MTSSQQADVEPVMKKNITPSSAIVNLQEVIRTMIDELIDDVRDMAGKVVSEGLHDGMPVDADVVERRVYSEVNRIGNKCVNLFLTDLAELLGRPARLCRDGREFERKVTRTTQYRTVFGMQEVERSIYYNGTERIVPMDEAANLPARRDSYFLQEILSRFSIDGTYRSSAQSVADYFGALFSTGTIDDVLVGEAEHSEGFYSKRDVDADDEGEYVFLQVDGKGVNLQGREGKKESMVGCIGSVDPHVRDPKRLSQGLVYPSLLEFDSPPAEQPPRTKNAQYFGSVEMSREEFFEYIKPLVEKRMENSRHPLLILMDGCQHLWDLSEEILGHMKPIKILDLIHVIQYLWNAAKALGDEDPRIAVTAWLEVLLEGEVGKVIGYLKQRLTKKKTLSKKKRHDVGRTITYFENHREMMKYDEYLAAGYPIATGVIESACKHIVQNRLEKAGAKWTIKGAEAMIKMRCIRANGDWLDYQEYRKQKEKERLYPVDLAS